MVTNLWQLFKQKDVTYQPEDEEEYVARTRPHPHCRTHTVTHTVTHTGRLNGWCHHTWVYSDERD